MSLHKSIMFHSIFSLIVILGADGSRLHHPPPFLPPSLPLTAKSSPSRTPLGCIALHCAIQSAQCVIDPGCFKTLQVRISLLGLRQVQLEIQLGPLICLPSCLVLLVSLTITTGLHLGPSSALNWDKNVDLSFQFSA